MFRECKKILGFDIRNFTTIADEENSIDRAYKIIMEEANTFLDPLHVRKNLAPKLWMVKVAVLVLYDRLIYAPSMAEIASIKEEYSRAQMKYLGKFNGSGLYRGHSVFQYTVNTSRRAESVMHSAVKNPIRPVEPQKMLPRSAKTFSVANQL